MLCGNGRREELGNVPACPKGISSCSHDISSSYMRSPIAEIIVSAPQHSPFDHGSPHPVWATLGGVYQSFMMGCQKAGG